MASKTREEAQIVTAWADRAVSFFEQHCPEHLDAFFAWVEGPGAAEDVGQ
jgi:hypothetical protein